MSTLTDILPQPRVALVGGREFMVTQLQLKDIAFFQMKLEMRQPHPFAVAKDKIRDAQGEEREALILRVKRDDAFYPPLYTGYETFEDLVDFLERMLNKHQVVSREEVMELALAFSAEEAIALDAIAYNDNSKEQFYRLVKGPEKKKGNEEAWGRKDQWGEILHHLVTTYRMTYTEIGELYLSQYHMLLAKGKAKAFPVVRLGYEAACERAKRERRLLNLEV
jgi:hypothetical protein